MEQFFSYSGWLMGIIGLILSIVGIYLSIQALDNKEPLCFFKSYRNIVKLSKEDKLKILYEGNEVDSISTTYVFFWNRGKKPIRKEDLQTPLLLALVNKKQDVKLLDHRVLKVSREVINFQVNKFEGSSDFALNQCSFMIDFDFLDQNDGAVIELKHSGEIPITIPIGGVILGVPKGIKSNYLVNNKLARGWTFKGVGSTLMESILGLYMISFAVLSLLQILLIGYQPKNLFMYVVSLLSLPAALFVFYTVWKKHNLPYPKSLDIQIDIATYRSRMTE